MMAQPDDYEKFLKAARDEKVGLNWGHNNIKAWAKKKGWPTPFLGFKKALIKKMSEDKQNYIDAMVHGGVDVYIPD